MSGKMKFFSLLLALLMVLPLAGCGGEGKNTDMTKDSTESATARSSDDTKDTEETKSGSDTEPGGTLPVSTDKVKIGSYLWYAFSSVSGVKEFADGDFMQYRKPVWGYGYCEQEDMDYQIQLASLYGIDYFAIDYYNSVADAGCNFGLDYFLASPYTSLMEFCLCVVQDTEVTVPTYESWDDTCKRWMKYMTAGNYLKVDGCPVIMFSNPGIMVNKLGGEEKTKECLDRLEQKMKDAGYPGIIVAGFIWDTFDYFLEESYNTGTSPSANVDKEISMMVNAGFDTVTQYNNISHAYYVNGELSMEMPFAEMTRRHELVWDVYGKKTALSYIPCLTSGWDNRPREGGTAKTPYATDRTAEKFSEHIVNSYLWIKNHPDSALGNLVIINAWDELEEGGYIIPTEGEGYKMLEGVADAVRKINAMD